MWSVFCIKPPTVHTLIGLFLSSSTCLSERKWIQLILPSRMKRSWIKWHRPLTSNSLVALGSPLGPHCKLGKCCLALESQQCVDSTSHTPNACSLAGALALWPYKSTDPRSVFFLMGLGTRLGVVTLIASPQGVDTPGMGRFLPAGRERTLCGAGTQKKNRWTPPPACSLPLPRTKILLRSKLSS